jgi:hypothetical protein
MKNDHFLILASWKFPALMNEFVLYTLTTGQVQQQMMTHDRILFVSTYGLMVLPLIHTSAG